MTILTEEELVRLGFEPLLGDTLDDGSFYKWWRLRIGNLHLDYTIDYDKAGIMTGSYVEIDDTTFPNITKPRLLTLIQILQDGRKQD